MKTEIRVTKDGRDVHRRFPSRFAAEVYVLERVFWEPTSKFEVLELDPIGEGIAVVVRQWDPSRVNS